MSDGLRNIGVHAASLVAYLVNFLVLLGLLYFIAYRPFLRMWREREARAQETLRDSEEARRAREAATRDRELTLAAAAHEAERAVQEGRHRGEVEESRLIMEGQGRAQAMMKHAQEQMRGEERKAIEEIRGDSSDLVILATEKVLGRALDRETHHRIIESAAQEVAALTLEPPGRRLHVARVASAVPLTADELAQIKAAIARLAGAPIPVICHTDPELRGGFTLTIDDMFVDASLTGRLQDLHGKMRG